MFLKSNLSSDVSQSIQPKLTVWLLQEREWKIPIKLILFQSKIPGMFIWIKNYLGMFILIMLTKSITALSHCILELNYLSRIIPVMTYTSNPLNVFFWQTLNLGILSKQNLWMITNSSWFIHNSQFHRNLNIESLKVYSRNIQIVFFISFQLSFGEYLLW